MSIVDSEYLVLIVPDLCSFVNQNCVHCFEVLQFHREFCFIFKHIIFQFFFLFRKKSKKSSIKVFLTMSLSPDPASHPSIPNVLIHVVTRLKIEEHATVDFFKQ